MYHGILFKFATDWLNIYSGDEFAMVTKPLNHVLTGVESRRA